MVLVFFFIVFIVYVYMYASVFGYCILSIYSIGLFICLFISLLANTGLNLSHFNSFHTYRVEWELPGTMLEKVESKEKSDKDKKKKGDNDDGGGGERISVESKGYIRW